jgi:hypothetical protein
LRALSWKPQLQARGTRGDVLRDAKWRKE